MLREFGGAASTNARKGSKDAAQLFSREVECVEALKDHAKNNAAGSGFVPLGSSGGSTGAGRGRKWPFGVCLGVLEWPDDLEQIDAGEWEDALGTGKPREGAQWLVYDWDGLNTVARFCVPQSVRVDREKAWRANQNTLGLPPAPVRVDWAVAKRFVVEGVMRKVWHDPQKMIWP